MVNAWIAYCRIEPFGREWEQAAGIMRQMEFLRQTLLGLKGVKPDSEAKDSLDIANYMPGEYSTSSLPKPRRTRQEEIDYHRSLAASHQHRR